MTTMVWLIFAMVLCIALGGAVLGLVAVPARREGKTLLVDRREDSGDESPVDVADADDDLSRAEAK